MNFLHVSQIRWIATGGNLSTATPKTVTKDVVELTMNEALIEHFISQYPQPLTRYGIGINFKVKGILAAATLDDLAIMKGGTHLSNTYTRSQSVRTLPAYDLRLEVYRPSDGATKNWDVTAVQFTADVVLGFQHGKVTYMPFEANGTYTSSLTITNT